MALAEELGIPRSVAAHDVDQLEAALAQEIKLAAERIAKAAERDKKRRDRD